MTDFGAETRATLSATTRALLVADAEQRHALLDPSIVDVSHGEGIPIGSLGSGHSVFGRSGFQRVAFDGAPDMGPEFDTLKQPADFGFYLFEGKLGYVLQDKATLPRQIEARGAVRTMERVFAYAELPKAHFRFEHPSLELGVVMTAFSPLIAHDLEVSTTPVQVFDLTVRNPTARERSLELCLSHTRRLSVDADVAVASSPGGQIAFSADGGEADPRGVSRRLHLGPGEVCTVRFFVAWYFPEFRTPSPVAATTYRRFYTRRFADAPSVVESARGTADEWSRRIDAWRAAFRVPAPMKRLWFSSLASVISSTMLSDDPFFFAIEAPHEWVNTMDVAVYANWVYLVNWPELERADLDQYLRVIETKGEQAGFVWHSVWSDAAHYAEEPTFLTRLWRAYLWSGDTRWLDAAYDQAVAAANYAYRHDRFEALLNSKKGNQSYDEWMMPGASAYVNIAWVHALYALERMGRTLNRPAPVAGSSAGGLRARALENLEQRLWTDQLGGYYRCFFRTPGASGASVPEAIFTDQLFGRWVLLVDRESTGVLPAEHVESALRTIHTNNLLEDAGTGFRGWVNGKLPNGAPDVESGYHARTCWLGAQLDLASLLGAVGDEGKSLDVFLSVEKSLCGNHLAVGEWNRAIDAHGRVVVQSDFGKDTPRFPPYPRYTSSWEYLLRMLGLTLTEHYLYLAPFRSLDFELGDWVLAGVTLSVRVEANWTRALANGVALDAPVKLRRDVGVHRVEFVVG